MYQNTYIYIFYCISCISWNLVNPIIPLPFWMINHLPHHKGPPADGCLWLMLSHLSRKSRGGSGHPGCVAVGSTVCRLQRSCWRDAQMPQSLPNVIKTIPWLGTSLHIISILQVKDTQRCSVVKNCKKSQTRLLTDKQTLRTLIYL